MDSRRKKMNMLVPGELVNLHMSPRACVCVSYNILKIACCVSDKCQQICWLHSTDAHQTKSPTLYLSDNFGKHPKKIEKLVII